MEMNIYYEKINKWCEEKKAQGIKIHKEFPTHYYDAEIVKAAKRLTAFQNEFIRVYHQSGDEFIILIHDRTLIMLKELQKKS